MAEIPVKSVKKAFDLLDFIVFEEGDRGVSLTELAERLKAPANSTRNLLKSMIASGYVEQNGSGRYAPGPKCRELGRASIMREWEPRAAIERAVQDMSRKLGESIVFVTLVDGMRWLVAHADPDRAVKVDVSSVRGEDPFVFVSGRVLLAFATAEERARALERHGMPQKRWNGIRSIAAFEAACEALRKQGYGSVQTDAEETFSIACPVLKADGQLIGALGCFAPQFRTLKRDEERIRNALLSMAERLGKRIHTGGG